MQRCALLCARAQIRTNVRTWYVLKRQIFRFIKEGVFKFVPQSLVGTNLGYRAVAVARHGRSGREARHAQPCEDAPSPRSERNCSLESAHSQHQRKNTMSYASTMAFHRDFPSTTSVQATYFWKPRSGKVVWFIRMHGVLPRNTVLRMVSLWL